MPDLPLPPLASAESLIALLTLTALEIVLGIDNIVFIVILTGRLDPGVQSKARRTGLAAAMIMRILLLLALGWVMGLTRPLFAMLDHEVTGKDLVLLAGGLFLIAKATYEIHHKMEGPGLPEAGRPAGAGGTGPGRAAAGFSATLVQIMLLDIVFSIDSVITAVGMARRIEIMIAAVVLAVGVMLAFAEGISGFVERHPTLKVLALAFLVLIGVMLVAEGLGQHIPKGYVYFAMTFSLAVEMINIRVRRRGTAAA